MNRRVVFAGLTLIAGCDFRIGGPSIGDGNYSRERAQQLVSVGNKLVEAIRRFEADHALCPSSLNELLPEYSDGTDHASWRYHTFNHGDVALVYAGRFPCGLLRFEQDWRSPGGTWAVLWEGPGEKTNADPVAVPPPRTFAPTLRPDEIVAKRLSVVRARIATMPNRVEHREGLIGHFLGEKQHAEARAVCVACIEKWPDYWWSYLMLARVEAESGVRIEAEQRLVRLAERWNDFFGYSFLAQYHFDRKENEKCKAALRHALRPAVTGHKYRYVWEEIGRSSTSVADWYYHNAAVLAYRLGDRVLCLAICDRWKEFSNTIQHYGAVEERVVRIVCAMNAAEWERVNELFVAMKQDEQYASWQDDGIQRLGQVIARKDAAYAYDPNLFRDSGLPLRAEVDYK